ncbi:MAG TPA: hypothetical protein VFQ25_03895 [Ktedonobacterales bacterium]|nr:hypothetical protein [Ktedonobacterales bacterium]
MSARAAPWLAWGIWIIALVLNAPDLYFLQVNPGSDPLAINLTGVLVFMAFATVGALLASRRPRNAVGWLLLSAGLFAIAGGLGIDYAVYGLVARPGALPEAALAGALGNMLRSAGFDPIVTFLLLLFPTGRLPSPRWRWLAWATAIVIIVAIGSQSLGANLSTGSEQLASIANPVGVIPADVADVLQTIFGFFLTFACIIGCCASVVVRYRRAGGVERQQIEWLAVAGVWAALAFLVVIVGVFSNNDLLASSMTFYIALVGIPLAVGIAILRHRLFDIDVIINRALVYGLLTALLAGLYFAGVVGAQALVNVIAGRELTGQPAQEQPVIIVVTTLAIAALFQPLRRGLQTLIDRRFYRRKYDAAHTLARFGETLRTDVELHALTDHLVTVVDETMQPTHVSLWLRQVGDRPPLSGEAG